MIMAREGKAEYEGYHYNLPYNGEDGTRIRKAAQEYPAGLTLAFLFIPHRLLIRDSQLAQSLLMVFSLCG